MTYRVIVTPIAHTELYETVIWWIENRSADQAERWMRGIEETIKSLADEPERYAFARERTTSPSTYVRSRMDSVESRHIELCLRYAATR